MLIPTMNGYNDGSGGCGGNCPLYFGWMTDEVKVGDDMGNWEEAGVFYGWEYDSTSYPEEYYWSDSRPQDFNYANYHLLSPVAASDVGYNLQIDISRDQNDGSKWYPHLIVRALNNVRTYNNISIANPITPTNVQMGMFLIGINNNAPGFTASPATFASRYYAALPNAYGIGIYGNYRTFVDRPPYLMNKNYDKTGTDFVTYCCDYSSGIGSLAAKTTANVVSLPPATAAVAVPAGMPAVHPQGQQTEVSTRAIVQSDVEQYVQQHVMPLTTTAHGKPSVMSARILTSKQISRLLYGESTGFSDARQLWFVEVDGTFDFLSAKGKPGSCHHGYEVFDPTTGNMMMFGGMQ